MRSPVRTASVNIGLHSGSAASRNRSLSPKSRKSNSGAGPLIHFTLGTWADQDASRKAAARIDTLSVADRHFAFGQTAMAPASNVTDLLVAWSRGDRGALTALVPLVYDELRELARRFLGQERVGHTLQPTALVHEAYARLIDQDRVHWQGRTHFFAVAAQAMRRVLVDHARKRHAARRGGPALRVTLADSLLPADRHDVDLIGLHEALTALGELDARHARIVELRYFGGLSIEETAEELSISLATVKRDWTLARAWLRREMTRR
jgi:RNA polymerase sigma factor (TIGR02999 family)